MLVKVHCYGAYVPVQKHQGSSQKTWRCLTKTKTDAPVVSLGRQEVYV